MFDNTHFPKAKKYWSMGKFYDWSKPNIHCMTHALHYGTSVFEGIRAYSTSKGPAVFQLKKHIDRFMHSASVLNMKVPYTKEEIMDTIKFVLRKNKLDSAYIRPILFYSYGNPGLVPKECPVELIIGAWEWGAYLGEKSAQGVSVYILPWRRVHHSQYDMAAKLGGIYVQSTICGVYARTKGCDEAVFLNLEGNVAEGPGENILLIKDGVLKTNDMTESVLEGITRTSILKIAEDQGIPTKIEPITKEDLFQADELFFSGTAVEVIPIVRITDGSQADSPDKEYTVGNGIPGPVTKKLKRIFMEIVGGKRPEYEDWLVYTDE